MGIRALMAKQDKEPVKDGRSWSDKQQAIFDWFKKSNQGSQHLIVRAKAGTGKTTTIIEGINRAPEPSILLCAFNKRIATELSSRITNSNAEAKTLHAIGYQAIRQNWGAIPVASGSARADDLTNRVTSSNTPFQIKRMVTNLHTKGREMCPLSPSLKQLIDLAYFFDYVPDEGWSDYDVTYVAKAALSAMQVAASEDKPYRTGIDYADMIYQPLVRNWLTPIYDLVVVDEGQDMTEAQLTIAQRVCTPGGRLCIVGDDRQAIYGFRGADSSSLDRLKRELQADELPLNVTYRCGHHIVKEAQRLVPDIQAAPSNELGAVLSASFDEMMGKVSPGDFVLSRLNAPLVSITLKLLSRKVRARMAGRDLGTGVLAIIRKMKCQEYDGVEKLLVKIQEWEAKTVTKYVSVGRPELADRVKDQVGMIYALADGIEVEDNRDLQVRDLIDTCNYLFEEPGDDSKSHVICSSIHKAKGLETDRVYLLQESLYRRGVSQEEQNLEYVGITRAKQQLIRVTEVPGLKK